MSRVLVLLSVGGARGAQQVAPCEFIHREHGIDAIGGSSVGAINASGVACGKVERLRGIWANVKGVRSFMKLQPDIWNGAYQMNPLGKLMEAEAVLGNYIMPFHVGVFWHGTRRHSTLRVPQRPDKAWEYVRASASIPLQHGRVKLKGRWVGDGGILHPIPTYRNWRLFDEIHVVFCAPNKRLPAIPEEAVNRGFEQADNALDVRSTLFIKRCHDRLRRWKSLSPSTHIFVYEPRDWVDGDGGDIVGPTFDADPRTIRRRLDHGDWMVENRTEL